MKKLVTIRKARKGEKPEFVNKTAKFLKKAQPGMEVESGSGEYNEKILTYVAEQILELGQDPNAVYETLVQSKIDPEIALEHVQAILQFQQNSQQEEQPQQPVDQETAYLSRHPPQQTNSKVKILSRFLTWGTAFFVCLNVDFPDARKPWLSIFNIDFILVLMK